MSKNNSYNTSISEWLNNIQNLKTSDLPFLRKMWQEESVKVDRLKTLSQNWGLPIYQFYEFLLPEQRQEFISTCKSIIENNWGLALRYSTPDTGRVVFRELNANLNIAIQYSENLSGKMLARVSEYKVPNISGTLHVSRGNLNLEMVYGPHEWLTKSPPEGISIYRGKYHKSDLSVKYSTDDQYIREDIYKCIKTSLWLVSHLRIRELSDNPISIYAEFHWHTAHGIRFIECSFSDAWTK